MAHRLRRMVVYTPQMMFVGLDKGPFWMGCEMDAGAAHFTTYLSSDQIIAYPKDLVQRVDTHPALISGSKSGGMVMDESFTRRVVIWN